MSEYNSINKVPSSWLLAPVFEHVFEELLKTINQELVTKNWFMEVQ